MRGVCSVGEGRGERDVLSKNRGERASITARKEGEGDWEVMVGYVNQ